jgi:uncharacterized protein (DUF427 family)
VLCRVAWTTVTQSSFESVSAAGSTAVVRARSASFSARITLKIFGMRAATAILFETGLPSRYYILPEDVRERLHQPERPLRHSGYPIRHDGA